MISLPLTTQFNVEVNSYTVFPSSISFLLILLSLEILKMLSENENVCIHCRWNTNIWKMPVSEEEIKAKCQWPIVSLLCQCQRRKQWLELQWEQNFGHKLRRSDWSCINKWIYLSGRNIRCLLKFPWYYAATNCYLLSVTYCW